MSRQNFLSTFWPSKFSSILSVFLGGLVGLFFRFSAQLPWLHTGEVTVVMTATFLVLGPFATGYITVSAAERAKSQNNWQWFLLPWPAVLLGMTLTWLLNLEGLICIVFALPIALLCSSFGGVAAGIVARRQRRRRALPIVCIALLPLLLPPMEARLNSPIQYRFVETQIRIHAPASTVWSNIERVRPIAPAELRPTWSHAIGFPRPVEATLSYEGVGSVRHASFEHGLMFIETVTRWEVNRVLSFSIKADTAAIPTTTLDEHATIGGRYFDVLHGEYRIEPLGERDILLHLSSEEQLSTNFNGYAGLWTDAVMRSLQESILQVIKNRCESKTLRIQLNP